MDDRLIEIPVSTSVNRSLKKVYFREPYSFITQAGLVVESNCNYYESRGRIENGYRMSDASEELVLQLSPPDRCSDAIKSEYFSDLVKSHDGIWLWQWTDTALRVPVGWSAGRYETNLRGKKKWPRIVLLGDEEVADVMVPEPGTVASWDRVFGVASETRNFPDTYGITRFAFDPNPPTDPISGKADVVIARRIYMPMAGSPMCFFLHADFGRYDADCGDCYRPVQCNRPQAKPKPCRI